MSRKPVDLKKLNSSSRALEQLRVVLSYRAIQSYYVKEQRQESVRLPFVVYRSTKSNSVQMLSRCLRTQDRRHRVACGERERNLALLASLALERRSLYVEFSISGARCRLFLGFACFISSLNELCASKYITVDGNANFRFIISDEYLYGNINSVLGWRETLIQSDTSYIYRMHSILVYTLLQCTHS